MIKRKEALAHFSGLLGGLLMSEILLGPSATALYLLTA